MTRVPTLVRLDSGGPVATTDAKPGPTLAEVIDECVEALDAGQTVVLPTDTVYGVAAHLEHPDAIEALFALKARDRSRALAVLVADAAQAESLLDLASLDGSALSVVERMMHTAWPGALTLVGPRAEHLAGIDLGGDPSTIGVRVPDSPVVRAIAARIGPIVTTSANRSGEPTPVDAAAAARSLDGEAALVVDGGPLDGEPSTVVDVTVSPFAVLRRGGCDLTRFGIADG